MDAAKPPPGPKREYFLSIDFHLKQCQLSLFCFHVCHQILYFHAYHIKFDSQNAYLFKDSVYSRRLTNVKKIINLYKDN